MHIKSQEQVIIISSIFNCLIMTSIVVLWPKMKFIPFPLVLKIPIFFFHSRLFATIECSNVKTNYSLAGLNVRYTVVVGNFHRRHWPSKKNDLKLRSPMHWRYFNFPPDHSFCGSWKKECSVENLGTAVVEQLKVQTADQKWWLNSVLTSFPKVWLCALHSQSILTHVDCWRSR